MNKLICCLIFHMVMTVGYSQDKGIIIADGDEITCFDVNRTSNRLIAGTLNGEIILWDTKTNTPLGKFQNNLVLWGALSVRSVSITDKEAFVIYGLVEGGEMAFPNYLTSFSFPRETHELGQVYPVISKIDLTNFSITHYKLIKDKFVQIPLHGYEGDPLESLALLSSEYSGGLADNKLVLRLSEKKGPKFTVSEYNLSTLTKTNAYSGNTRKDYYGRPPVQITSEYQVFNLDLSEGVRFGFKLPTGALYLEVDCIQGFYNEDGNFYFIKKDGTLNKANLKSKQSTVLADNFSTPAHDLIYADGSVFIIREDVGEFDPGIRFKYTFHDLKTNSQSVRLQREFPIVCGVVNDQQAFLQYANGGQVIKDVTTGSILSDFGSFSFLKPRFLDSEQITYGNKDREFQGMKFSATEFARLADTSALKPFHKFKVDYDPEQWTRYPEPEDDQQWAAIKNDQVRQLIRQQYERVAVAGLPSNDVKWIEYDRDSLWLFVQRDKNFEIYNGRSGQKIISSYNTMPYYGYQLFNDHVVVLYNSFRECLEYWDLKTGKIILSFFAYQHGDSKVIHWVALTPEGIFDADEFGIKKLSHFDGKSIVPASSATGSFSPGLVLKSFSLLNK